MLQDIVGTLRQVGRSYLRIWRFTEPIRAITLQAFWDVRNLITRGRPLVIPVNSSLSVLFYPTGQVAKALWSNDFEARERDFVAYFVRSGMTVLNAGANSGLYCILLSALVGASGHVYAFEPSSENCSRLKQNLALNSCRNVTVVRAALSDFCGTGSLRYDSCDARLDAHRFLDRTLSVAAAHGELVPCITLDRYWHELHKENPAPVDLMFMDVEGAELDVLRGARKTIEVSPALTIHAECTQRLDGLEALMKELGFACFTWDDGNHRLVPSPIRPGNLIFRRGGAASDARHSQTWSW
jgi:FkbM family methyltransferase